MLRFGVICLSFKGCVKQLNGIDDANDRLFGSIFTGIFTKISLDFLMTIFVIIVK